jgi:hypothetical protein
MRHCQALLAIVLGLASVVGAQSAAGADSSVHPVGYDIQQRAQTLQRCLEKSFAPLQVESSVTRDGRVEDTVRVTRWGSASISGGANPNSGSDCAAPAATGSTPCTPSSAVHPVIGLNMSIGEQHSSWSANDRARLEDGLVDTLVNLGISTQVRVPRNTNASRVSHAEEGLSLRVSINYRGSPLSQRVLDEWLRLPLTASISMELIDTAKDGRVIAARNIEAHTRPGYRAQISGGIPGTWRETVLEAVARSAREMIQPISCALPVLPVTMSAAKLWIDTSSVSGLDEGHALLLVPSMDTSISSQWPIVRVREANRASLAELDVVRGDASVCAAGCRALPL